MKEWFKRILPVFIICWTFEIGILVVLSSMTFPVATAIFFISLIIILVLCVMYCIIYKMIDDIQYKRWEDD